MNSHEVSKRISTSCPIHDEKRTIDDIYSLMSTSLPSVGPFAERLIGWRWPHSVNPSTTGSRHFWNCPMEFRHTTRSQISLPSCRRSTFTAVLRPGCPASLTCCRAILWRLTAKRDATRTTLRIPKPPFTSFVPGRAGIALSLDNSRPKKSPTKLPRFRNYWKP